MAISRAFSFWLAKLVGRLCKLIGHTPRGLDGSSCRRCGEVADRFNEVYLMSWYYWPYRLYWWLRLWRIRHAEPGRLKDDPEGFWE